MLTKSEREKIAERANDCIEDRFLSIGIRYANLYRCLLCKSVPEDTAVSEDFVTMLTRIIDLCDTSNMIELPLDKNGEVIRVGDTVYDKDGGEGKVGGYYYNNGAYKIIIPYGQNGCYINVNPNEIMHKKPVTIVSLNERLRHVLDKGQMSAWSMAELCDIADDLEMLGDSDD